MRKVLLLILTFGITNCFSQGIQSEKYFLFENMCDNIHDSIYQVNKTKPRKVLDSLIRSRIIECSNEYVVEISKTRFTYPYRIITKNLYPLPSQTELLFADKHYNISDENINSGFAEQYPYEIYDSLMYIAITNKYGDNIFKTLKKSCDSLIKKGKGYKSAKTLGRKNEIILFKEIFHDANINKIKCSSMHLLTITLDIYGKSKDIEIIQLGWHGRTMPSDCEELIKIVETKKDKLEKIKWKPAEFEGQPMISKMNFSFHEFAN